MAERLFAQLESTTKRFEVKLMTLDVISRLVGVHTLFLSNFYPYLSRFLNPHQRGVTRILQFLAQASHDLVPPDDLEPVLKIIANNFITERNSSDVMAIGLNAVREICARSPLAMNEDLLRDLAQYKSYRERAVMMASQSLIHLFRNTRPDLLHKKDRGRPTEFTAELKSKSYGELDAKDYIPGAEVLLNDDKDEIEINSDTDSDDDQWIKVQHSPQMPTANDEEEDEEGEEEEFAEGEWEECDEEEGSNDEDNECEESEAENSQEEDASATEGSPDKKKPKKQAETEAPKRKILKAKRKKQDVSMDIEAKKELAQKISLDRILTDEDFKRIDLANVKKQVQSTRKGLKRKIEEEKIKTTELVQLKDIEYIYKKKKHDKQSRIESVEEGRKDREKFGYKDGRVNIHCSKTNREKRKKKNYQMIKHKVQGKVKRSFKDKQVALRNHLLKLKKMK